MNYSQFTLQKANQLLQKYPDHYPTIVTVDDKHVIKFMVGSDITIGKLFFEVRKKLTDMKEPIPSYVGLFTFIKVDNNKQILCTASSTIKSLYEKHANNENFLHLHMIRENTFG